MNGSTIPRIDSAAVVTAVLETVTETMTMINDLLPFALTVFAATWGFKRAMRFFKTAAN